MRGLYSKLRERLIVHETLPSREDFPVSLTATNLFINKRPKSVTTRPSFSFQWSCYGLCSMCVSPLPTSADYSSFTF